MKHLLHVDDATGARFELALEQFANGPGFVFDAIWFRKDGRLLRCEAISQSIDADVTDSTARELADHARAGFERLCSTSSLFRNATRRLDPRFAVIADYGTGTATIAEIVDGRLRRP